MSDGLELIERKVRGWTRFVETCWGSLPAGLDSRDVTQQAHANLAKEIGEDHIRKIEAAMARPGFEQSPVGLAVRRCIWRAVGTFASRSAKRKDLHASLEELGFEPAAPPDAANGTGLVDQAIDLTLALDRLSGQEKRVWDLAYRGMTLREIGDELGISHQAAGRIRTRVVKKLGEILRE